MIRGIDGSLLARFRGQIKQEYGKTKDKDGSIVARVLNALMGGYLSEKQIQIQPSVSSGETDKAERKTRSRFVAEDILRTINRKGLQPIKHAAAIVQIIRQQCGSDYLLTVVHYVRAVEKIGGFTSEEAEQITNAAYKLYGVQRRGKKFENLGMLNRVRP
jgi:tellurite resistance protein